MGTEPLKRAPRNASFRLNAQLRSLLSLLCFAASVFTSSNAANLTLEWDRSPDEDNVVGYKIYLAGERQNFLSINVGATNRYSFSNLVSNRRYLIFVVAYNSFALESAPSAVLQYPQFSPCLIVTSPAGSFLSSSRSSDSFLIISAGDCPFLSTTDDSWIDITNVTSHGGATLVSYVARTNPRQTPRSGFISTGGQSFQVYQNQGGPVPPLILVHLPGSSLLTEGEQFQAQVTVEDDGEPVAYQWFKDDLPILGATDSSFLIDPVGADDAGQYSVHVTNSGGVSVDGPLALSVLARPRILRQPALRSVDGQPFLFVDASGSDLHFVWSLNSIAIDNDAALLPILPGQAGAFQVSISNTLGTIQSDPVSITPQTVDQDSGRISVTLTANLRLHVEGRGIPGVTYDMESSRDLVHWSFIDSVTVSDTGSFAIDAPIPETDTGQRWFVRTVRRL